LDPGMALYYQVSVPVLFSRLSLLTLASVFLLSWCVPWE
jgi:hypothetical protein